MKSFFQRFKTGLSRTTKNLFSAVGGIFGRNKLGADAIDSLEEALYTADFGMETSTEIIEEIQAAYKADKELRGLDAARIGAKVLREVLKGSEGRLDAFSHKPEVICLIGVNGSGKTTTAAKLGHQFQVDGRKPVLAACDTFRAAANEQIKAWSDRLGLDLVASQHGADAAAVAFDAWQAAKKRDADVLIIDTAGRLHNKSNLMKELAKIKRVLQKNDKSAPHHRWLVIDGTLGSNSIEQARVFNEAFGLTGLIITKLDGTSRGGALAGIFRELRIPIYFVGLGEQKEDLQPFSIENYINAVFALEDETEEEAAAVE